MRSKDFVSALDEARISEAISEAEKRTSGEIRVFVTERHVDDALAEARKQFIKLGMANTEQRNAVLLYFAPKSQAYAVLGDEGVHQKCGQNFWQHITEEMHPLLKQGKFSDAIVLAVRDIGESLSREFPWTAADRNELPNQVARDEPPEPPGAQD